MSVHLPRSLLSRQAGRTVEIPTVSEVGGTPEVFDFGTDIPLTSNYSTTDAQAILLGNVVHLRGDIDKDAGLSVTITEELPEELQPSVWTQFMCQVNTYDAQLEQTIYVPGYIYMTAGQPYMNIERGYPEVGPLEDGDTIKLSGSYVVGV